jgi:hypothetical protein
MAIPNGSGASSSWRSLTAAWKLVDNLGDRNLGGDAFPKLGAEIVVRGLGNAMAFFPALGVISWHFFLGCRAGFYPCWPGQMFLASGI